MVGLEEPLPMTQSLGVMKSETFTHWLPLFINQDHAERALQHLKVSK